LSSLSHVPVKKVRFGSIADAERAAKLLASAGIATFESDVRPRERFLMDRHLNGGVSITGESRPGRGAMRVFTNPVLSAAQLDEPPLSLCSLDIETSVTTGQILSIGVHLSGARGEDRRVFMQGGSGTAALEHGEMEFAANERELLERFLRWFSAADPDLI